MCEHIRLVRGFHHCILVTDLIDQSRLIGRLEQLPGSDDLQISSALSGLSVGPSCHHPVPREREQTLNTGASVFRSGHDSFLKNFSSSNYFKCLSKGCERLDLSESAPSVISQFYNRPTCRQCSWLHLRLYIEVVWSENCPLMLENSSNVGKLHFLMIVFPDTDTLIIVQIVICVDAVNGRHCAAFNISLSLEAGDINRS